MDLLQQLDLPSVSDSSDTDDFLQELAALNDVGLLRATMESLECGRLTPLIKEELRCRIQSRRLSEGKEELFVEFPSPTPTQPRPDEVEKRDRRREQNRRAAQKFRKKKKERGEHLMEETQRLECHNTTLRSEIKQLHEEREQLTRIIQNHASICPLTPRQSPLTITRDSPLSHSVRESPIPLTSFSGNILTTSPVMGKSPVLVQSPAILVPPTRESPVPLLIINPTRESPIPTSLIPSSPVPMSGRPRKSPVSLLRFNQSPIPGEKSPIPFGSPPKQSKHSVPPRLNLAGPKPVVPILPKPAATSLQNSPSPRTPKPIITSPLPIAPSPGSLGRSVHVSPVFFREGCFTPSGHSRHISQSPISVSDSSSNSTPARITQQSPVFFVDTAPSSAQHSSRFLQPLSASSMCSTSSLVTLLRQESPLSVLSNSSGISSGSSVFISNTSNLNVSAKSVVDNNTNAKKQNICASSNLEHSSNIPEQGPASYSCSFHCSAPGHPDDNVLSLEEIEKSASGFETRDDLIDMMDIQALLELSNEHSSGQIPAHPDVSERSPGDLGCHSINQDESNIERLASSQGPNDRSGCGSTHNVTLRAHGVTQATSDGSMDRSGCGSTHNVTLRAHGVTQCEPDTALSSAHARSQDMCVSLLTQNLNKLAGLSSEQAGRTADNASTLDQDGCSFDVDLPRCHNSSAFRELGTGHFQSLFASPKRAAFRDHSATIDISVLQTFKESQARKSLTVATLQQLHNQLSELIRREKLTESSSGRMPASLSVDDVSEFTSVRERHNGRNLVDDNCFLASADDLPGVNIDCSESDLINLHSSLPLDVLMTSASVCGAGADSVFSQASHP